jgi:hypothetical protein
MLNVKCSKCKQNKCIKQFPPNKQKKNGVDSWCRICRNSYRADIRSTLDGYLNEMGRWRKNSKYSRKIDESYNLTFEEKKNLWEKQKGLCALTGMPMTHIRGKGHVMTNASIDRIDSSKGYEINNVQLLMWCVNRGKGEMSTTDFLTMCINVVKNMQL